MGKREFLLGFLGCFSIVWGCGVRRDGKKSLEEKILAVRGFLFRLSQVFLGWIVEIGLGVCDRWVFFLKGGEYCGYSL